MNFLHAAFLAIVQGITEFLPISSSAHLVFLPEIFGWKDQGMVFDIAVHVGTLVAVIVYFYKYLFNLVKKSLSQIMQRKMGAELALSLKIGVATAPLVLLALVLAGSIDVWGRMVPVLATSSVVFGLLLWWADKRRAGCEHGRLVDEISWKEALIFGAFQALALIPGTSRSGICVTAGRLLGYSREQSGVFATLLAIPTILLAAVYSLTKMDAHNINWQHDTGILMLATLISMVTALFGIHLLVSWLARVGYVPFVIYRVILGVGLWVWFLA